MLLQQITTNLSQIEFAHLGIGKLAYIRKICSHEILRHFTNVAENIDPDLDLWALFGADGTPILFTGNRSSTFFKAAEEKLKTVTLH
ncbi:hypothetical protein B488_01640 [Liberibacter crescens BT-1]|uniref:DUF1150 family protein n=1 Tax=Liberibacter crescens (strain BT-1) TaxID=1215343 RepID=L0ET78_LIBCB|nr:DUF1150 family protein [Liberibacter crescens]AGA64157.1 hypothetical protein B488_01640 [Liberibacter crescens BT-1]AMC12423.1 hypothetical protein RL73_00995 [Liberibacter crescens]